MIAPFVKLPASRPARSTGCATSTSSAHGAIPAPSEIIAVFQNRPARRSIMWFVMAFPARSACATAISSNIDVTVIMDGWHGDTSRMYVAGDAGVKAMNLIDVTFEAIVARASERRQARRDIGRHRSRHPGTFAEGNRCSVGPRFLRSRPRPRSSTTRPTSCISATPAPDPGCRPACCSPSSL